MTFDREYVRIVLNENFEDAKELFLSPLIAIHYAHLVMLAEQGIVCSMSRAGEVWDNSAMESFFSSLVEPQCGQRVPFHSVVRTRTSLSRRQPEQ